jgi:hypothetical protein
LESLAFQYDNDGKIAFKYMEIDRYKKHLTYLGKFQIRRNLIVNMNKAKTVEAYLVRKSMREEVKHDSQMPLVMGVNLPSLQSR